MVAAMVFSVSVAGLAGFVGLWAGRVEDGVARVFLQVAAGAVLVGMALSGTYAVADFVGSEALTIPRMARTHGSPECFGILFAGIAGVDRGLEC